ncbi:MAG: polyphosphate kinase 1 [Holophagales bacterium]|nr:polyphosphate kinase 1 [Holophagales bacterium]
MSTVSTKTEKPAPKATVEPPPNRRRRRTEAPSLNNPKLYFNRELSWLEFNHRVLEEALDPENPLLERVKFLAIFSSNLDEFFMIRVSGLRRQVQAGAVNPPPDGMTAAEQLAAVHDRLNPMLEVADRCWREELMPALAAADIQILSYDQLKRKQRRLLRRHFESDIFPALTPLAFDPSHPFPHISNLSINLAVVVRHHEQGERFARLKVPHVFPRLLRIPTEDKAGAYQDLGLEDLSFSNFVWLEEVVEANLDLLFPGLEVAASYPFRITRDADFEIEEDEASDLLEAMEEVVGQRHFGFAVRLELDSGTPENIREILVRNLGLAPYQAFATAGPIGKSDLMQLTKVERPDLKDPPFLPYTSKRLASRDGILAEIRRRDQLLYHPYDSFNPVVDFIRAAARDPKVLTIKQTLYRVGPDSPIVQALMEARESGKQVAVMVELKARFDESNNIVWARALERAGVHVVYGVLGLKTHAKMSMVVRREERGTRYYVHLGTGNYNPVTARIYTDLGLFTCDPDIAADVSDLFNGITGYSRKHRYRKLLVAPRGMREGLVTRIEREIELHAKNGGGHIAFKTNALVDSRCIQALYEASQAGVKVDLQVRGICCLRPGVPEVSENITVTSIVGRFLEHTRIYYFRNGGEGEIFCGSADLMPRNLNGRVEVLFPVEDPVLKRAIRDDILFQHLADTSNARRLLPDGAYEHVLPAEGEEPLDSQALMMEHQAPWRSD